MLNLQSCFAQLCHFHKSLELGSGRQRFCLCAVAVLLLYPRQNYDRTCSSLGLAGAARYFAPQETGLARRIQTSAVLPSSSSTAMMYRADVPCSTGVTKPSE